MHFNTFLTYAALASTTGWAAYVLEDDFTSGDFFSQFSFWDAADPTNGFVQYVDQSTAASSNLTSNDGGAFQIRANSVDKAPNGRQSVRLTSNKSYQNGLVILDLDHMPASTCGSWPAFWMVGPDWPFQGEIDIIEGVNDQPVNAMTLHTGPGCSIGSGESFTGTLESTDCDVSNGDNEGCQIKATSQNTYGTGFNDNGGGTYAMNWNSKSIAIWFFPRGSEPADINSDSPNPHSWSEPLAHFSGGCDVSKSFTNQQIVFDTTFCGDWAGKVWGGSSCQSSTSCNTCEDFVANNPSAFAESYWSIKSLKVYQQGVSSSEHSSPAQSSYTPPATVSVPQSTPESAPQSSFQTVSTPAASPSGWAPTVGSSGVVGGAPIPTSTTAAAPSSPAEETTTNAWTPPASNTWADNAPWQSSGWGEWENDDGGWNVGVPVQRTRQHARHLRAHKMHAGRRH